MALPLLHTNVLLRHFTGDHEVQSPRASALIKRIGDGELQVQISNQVIFEAAFTLQKVYRVPKERIVEALKEVLDLDGLVLNGKDRWPPVFDLFTSSPRLSFEDCYLSCDLHATLRIERDPDLGSRIRSCCGHHAHRAVVTEQEHPHGRRTPDPPSSPRRSSPDGRLVARAATAARTPQIRARRSATPSIAAVMPAP